MNRPFFHSNSGQHEQNSFSNSFLSEVSTISNSTVFECLLQLQQLDHKLIMLQGKIGTIPDLKSIQIGLERLRSQEKERLNQLDEIRPLKNQTEVGLDHCRERIVKIEQIQQETQNPDEFHKNSKELLSLKSLEQSLELKASKIKREFETLATQITTFQFKQRELSSELQAKSTSSEAKDQETKSEIEQIEAQRLHFQELLPSQFLSLYQRIRANRGGIAIAMVFRNSCSACHMIFRPQFVIELTRSTDIVQCPACKRILLTPTEAKKTT